MSAVKKGNVVNSKLSQEVQLLFKMTEVDHFYGFPKSVSLVYVSDHFKEKDINGDVSVVLAKMICYEQIIENMIISLYKQDTFWRKINGYKEAARVDKHHKRLELMREFVNFDKKDEMRKLCNEFRHMRNDLAHEILQKKMEEWISDYSDVDERYEKIVSIYQEQECAFLNGVAKKLLKPEMFLERDKDYKRDIDIIKRQFDASIDDVERANCVQIMNLLIAFMRNYECPALYMKWLMELKIMNLQSILD